ncbi:MAG: efflux RND transporter periplasmic adaptor subunit [Candidatus Eisenbacteria bacterium]|nr:efflux RND transporter periplasmic adaptor subunit [Candidatus Eisenbacteria bacterium]
MRRLLFVLLLAALVSGCGGGGGEETARGPEAVPVEVLAIEPEDAVATVTATGTLEARDDIPISAEATGRVAEVLVTVGDEVAEGELLVRLDDELARLALRQAEAQLLAAEADLADAERGYDRSKALLEGGDISQAAFDAAELRYRAAESAFLAAEAAYGSAERGLRNTAIESPIDGTVAFVQAEVGHLINVGSPVAHVVNTEVLEIEIGLTEEQAVAVRPGRTAAVTVRSLPGREFRGRIEYVGPRARDRSKTFPAGVVLRNPDGSLRAGMVAEVTIATETFRDAVVIVRDWVVDRYGEPAVFVVADSLAELRRVRLGDVLGDRVVVEEGLVPGDLLVVLGYDQLSENVPVSIRNDPEGGRAIAPAASEPGDVPAGESF